MLMLKWAATVILNRLVFMAAFVMVLSMFTQNACHSSYNPIQQITQTLGSLKDVYKALE